MRPLLAAFVLLVGITSTDAALCSATSFGATVTTCDCPLGTAPAGSFESALPTGSYGVPAGNTVAQKRAAANVALGLCKDLLPGYKKTGNDKTMPAACVIGDGYCTGFAGAFAANAITSAAGTEGAYTNELTANLAPTGAGATLFVKSLAAIACPAGTANTGQSAPFTIYKCIVTNGKYVSGAAAGTAAVTTQCTAGKVCASGATAGDGIYTPVSCIGGGNTVAVVNGFICPAGTYGTLGTTLAASTAALTGKVMCGAGTGPKAGAVTCDVLDGYYGATSAAGVAATACPVGITGTANTAFKTGCTAIAPGYTVITAIPAQTTFGAITNLLSGVTACAVNKFCAGGGTVTFVGKSAAAATYAAVAASTGGAAAVACPAGTGNAVTTAAQGAAAVSRTKACVDLLEGYAFLPGVASTVTIGNLVSKCAANQYGCAGSANLFIDYTPTTVTLATATGLTAAGNAGVKDATDFLAGIASAATGSLVKLSCPGTSKSAASGASISTCLTATGKYVDHNDLNAETTCPVGKYCVGGAPLGTAGGASSCPAGSTGPTTSSVTNSNIEDCTVNDGFYIASGAVNVPVPCLTANICAGGGAVGTAGGSVACPTDSKNTACVAAVGTPSTATTVNLTPASQPITVTSTPTVAAAAAPDVTVTNTVPSASSASTTVASMVLMAVSAFVVAF